MKFKIWPQRPPKRHLNLNNLGRVSMIFSKITFLKSVYQFEKNELQLGFLVRLLEITVFCPPRSPRNGKKKIKFRMFDWLLLSICTGIFGTFDILQF